MSGRREREIVRRLQERGDVDPPADLLERIQAEIPAAVKVGAPSRQAESRPPARQRWLLAASLVAMIGAGLFSLHLYESDREELGAPRQRLSSPRAPMPPTPPMPVTPPMAPMARMAPPLSRVAPRADVAPAPRKPRPAPEAVSPRAEAEEKGIPAGVPGGVAGGIAPPAAETGSPQPVQPLSLPNEQADAMAASEPSEPAAAVAAPAAKTMMSKAERSLVSQPARGFVDAAAFPRDSFRPHPGPEAKERRAGNLADAVSETSSPVAEGAPAPFVAGERRRLVLFRLSGAAHSGPGAEVTFDPAAVARWRRVSAGAAVLYEVELQPGAPSEAAVATLRGGARLRVADLAPSWEQTSPGFRLVSLEMELAAVGEGGRPRSDLPELLRRARALAAEIPGDRQAADLVRRIERLSPQPSP